MTWPIVFNLVGIVFLLTTLREDPPARHPAVRAFIGIALLVVAFLWAR